MKKRATKPRRTQAERRIQTKAAIMEAALESLIEDGYSGFSASAVAARAGVSRGAQEHYYPKKINLVVAATKHAMNQAIEHADKSARIAHASADPVERFLESSEEFFFTPPFIAMTEIIIAARADKALAKVVHPIIKEARAILDGLWTETLADVGYSRDRARQFVEMSHYLLRGLFFVEMWLPYNVDRTAVIRAWRELAPAALRLGVQKTNCDPISAAVTESSS